MYRVTAGGNREVHNARNVQIAGHRIGSYVVVFVGLGGMEAVTVGIRENGDRLDAHFGTGPCDANGDLPPIGYQYFPDQSFFLNKVVRGAFQPGFGGAIIDDRFRAGNVFRGFKGFGTEGAYTLLGPING
jgi:hypothetical protein